MLGCLGLKWTKLGCRPFRKNSDAKLIFYFGSEIGGAGVMLDDP